MNFPRGSQPTEMTSGLNQQLIQENTEESKIISKAPKASLVWVKVNANNAAVKRHGASKQEETPKVKIIDQQPTFVRNKENKNKTNSTMILKTFWETNNQNDKEGKTKTSLNINSHP